MADEVLKKILKKVLSQIAGPGSEKIVDLLYNKQNVNEFLISKKLGTTINQTRNMLYKLGDQGFIEFTRKKDRKKGGWYTYFWTLRVKKILEKVSEETQKNIEKSKEDLKKRENERYYYSPSIEKEYTEEEAILNEFICPETGEVLQIKDNTAITSRIKGEISKSEFILAQLREEIGKIEVTEQKANQRKIKAEERKKELERKKKKEQREKEKAKELKRQKAKKSRKNTLLRKRKRFPKKKSSKKR